jgi:uncharacterized protein YacL (UPF0231 family)
MDNKKLLESKGFSLNTFPEGRFWELVEENNENNKLHICKIFGADIELSVDGTDVNTLILQCDENYNNCLLYYDCNSYNMSTEDFIHCVNKL